MGRCLGSGPNHAWPSPTLLPESACWLGEDRAVVCVQVDVDGGEEPAGAPGRGRCWAQSRPLMGQHMGGPCGLGRAQAFVDFGGLQVGEGGW